MLEFTFCDNNHSETLFKNNKTPRVIYIKYIDKLYMEITKNIFTPTI